MGLFLLHAPLFPRAEFVAVAIDSMGCIRCGRLLCRRCRSARHVHLQKSICVFDRLHLAIVSVVFQISNPDGGISKVPIEMSLPMCASMSLSFFFFVAVVGSSRLLFNALLPQVSLLCVIG